MNTIEFEDLKNKADSGDPKSIGQIGLCFLKGTFVEKDESKGFLLTKQSAELGESGAQHNLSCCYLYGMGTDVNEELAFKWLIIAANNGHGLAQFSLGETYYKGLFSQEKNYTLALSWYQKSANQGIAQAQFMLGQIYYKGIGCKQDMDKALTWLKLAANNDEERAMCLLADIYEHGWAGVPEDVDQAICFYKKAADKGIIMAKYYVGRLLLLIKRSYTEAFYLFESAANGNYPEAYLYLSMFYYVGLSVEPDMEKSKQLFERYNQLLKRFIPADELDKELSLACYELVNQLGVFLECDDQLDDAINYYSEGLRIAEENCFTENSVFSIIRIAKLYEQRKLVGIARSLYCRARWIALNSRSYNLYSTVAVNEMGMLAHNNNFDELKDVLLTSLRHFGMREIILYGGQKNDAPSINRKMKVKKIFSNYSL